MRSTLALLALPATTLAVSLVDFPPRVSGLPSACQSIYTAPIDGCSPTDFQGSNGCSVGCINSLQALVGPVQQACGNTDAVSGSILNAILHNAGTTAICGNAKGVLASMSASAASSTAAASSTSAVPTSSSSTTEESSEATPSTTVAPKTTSSVDSSSAEASATESETMSSMTEESTSSDVSSSTTSSIVMVGTSTASSLYITTTSAPSANPTSSSPTDTSSTTRASAKASQTSSSNSQNSQQNDGSGGGSPFDSAGNMVSGASTLESLSYGMMGLGGCMLAMAWS